MCLRPCPLLIPCTRMVSSSQCHPQFALIEALIVHCQEEIRDPQTGFLSLCIRHGALENPARTGIQLQTKTNK